MSKDSTRKISYLDDKGSSIYTYLELALKSTLEDNFKRYCAVVNAQLALLGIDPDTTSVKKIYYLEQE